MIPIILKQFDLIFIKNGTKKGELVKLATFEQYSHVAMIIENNYNDSLNIVESDVFKPVKIGKLYYDINDFDIYRLKIELTNEQKQKIKEFIMSELNKEYDWIYLITRFLHRYIGTPIVNIKSRYNCDELIWEAFKQIGIELVDKLQSPGQLSRSEWLIKIK